VRIDEAGLGAKIEVPTIDPRALLKVPQGTHNGQKFRLREKGVLNARTGKRGDQIVEALVQAPVVQETNAFSDEGKGGPRKSWPIRHFYFAATSGVRRLLRRRGRVVSWFGRKKSSTMNRRKPAAYAGFMVMLACFVPQLQAQTGIRAGSKPAKGAAATQTATLLLEAYNPDGSAVTPPQFGNYTNFVPTNLWGIYLNYGVFPLGTAPATAQVGSDPSYVTQNGVPYVSFAVPAGEPLYFTCLWQAPAIGTVFMRADNAGQGYAIAPNQTQVLEIPYEFALSEFNTAQQIASQYSASGYQFSADAQALLSQASAAVSQATSANTPSARAIASYAALAIVMPLKERLVLEISDANVSTMAPGRPFVLNYEGLGGWTEDAYLANYERAQRAGFGQVLLAVDWTAVSPAPGQYNWSVMDLEMDDAAALGYGVALTVNQALSNMPPWIQNLSFNDLVALYYQNARAVVTRYQSKLAAIYPIAETELATSGYSLAQLAQLVSQSIAGAKSVLPSMPMGYYASAAAYVGYQLNPMTSKCGCISSLDFLTYLTQNGVVPDYVGLEMQYGIIFSPLDLQRFFELLSTYHQATNLPIIIGETGYSSRAQDYGYQAPYYWHGGLTEAAEAEWASDVLRIAYGLPFVPGLYWVHIEGDNITAAQAQTCSCLSPENSSLLGTDLFRADGTPKPAYFVFQSFNNTVLDSKPNRLAPVITSTAPSAYIGAVGGTSVDFTVTAGDPGGNSLTYTWSVNGSVVATAFDSSFYWQVPLSASGAYIVAASVNNGFRSTQTTWQVSVTPGQRLKILFDESHSEMDTVSSEIAMQLNPQNPDLICFCELSGYLSQSYNVSRLAQGPITSQVLGDVGVLVLAAPNAALSTAENQAISQFVDSGGALVFMDTTGLDTSINALLQPWGIEYIPQSILTPSAPGLCAGCYALSSFSGGSILGNDPAFQVGYPGSFTVSGQAMPLAQTSSTEWRSNSGQQTQQPGDPNGPFTIIAASSSGSGKILAISNNFYDQYFDAYPQNATLLSSALDWLTSGRSGSAPPATGTLPLITATVNAGSSSGSIAPGAWISILGQNLSNLPAGMSWSAANFNGSDLPLSLGGTSVLVNGLPAAISYVSPTQLDVQAPDDTTAGTVSIIVTAPAGTAAGNVILQTIAPALFTISQGGVNYAAAAAPSYLIPPQQLSGPAISYGAVSAVQAAAPGQQITVFGTGFGAGLPSQPAGMSINPVPLAMPVTATICDQPATVNSAELAGPGLNQFKLTIPNVPAGNCGIVLSMQGVSTQSGVMVPIAASNPVAAFFSGQVSLGDNVYYLQFPNSTVFGYYTFVASTIFYHYDMGYEAFIAGSSGTDLYLFDFASGHWWYTNASSFPYLYDFTLNAWIYYFPNTTSPGHYTTNPRYFSNLTTGKIFTM
jgi:uncharacterized protein (TIGR03437 family)